MSASLERTLKELVAPIEGDAAPLGTPPSEDDFNSPAIELRSAFRSANDQERRGSEGDHAAELKQWKEAVRLSSSILVDHCKEFGTVAMLTSALVRLDGISGIKTGYELALLLADNYWEAFANRWGEDVDGALKPIGDLDSSLMRPLRRLPITENGLFVWQYEQSVSLENEDAETRQQKLDGGATSIEEFRQAITDSSDEFYRTLHSDVAEAKEAIQSFDNSIYKKLDEAGHTHAAPGTSDLLEKLDEIGRLVEEIAGDRLVDLEEESAAGGDGTAGGEGGGGSGGLHSREDAFLYLEKVAKFFEKTEPQSLLPPLVRWVIRQGKMTPAEMYSEMIDDDDGRRLLGRIVGPDKQNEDNFS